MSVVFSPAKQTPKDEEVASLCCQRNMITDIPVQRVCYALYLFVTMLMFNSGSPSQVRWPLEPGTLSRLTIHNWYQGGLLLQDFWKVGLSF